MRCIVIARKGMMHAHAYVTVPSATPAPLTDTEYAIADAIAALPDLARATQRLAEKMKEVNGTHAIGPDDWSELYDHEPSIRGARANEGGDMSLNRGLLNLQEV